MTKTVSVHSAKTADLLAHAQTVLGLPVDESTPRKELIAQVIAVGNIKEIPVEDDLGTAEVAAPVEKAASRKMTASAMTDGERIAARDARTVTLIIAKQTGVPGGDEDVPLGVNGSFMVVRRGIKQAVPMPFFRVLEAAVQDVYEPLENGGISSVPNKVPLYPYTVVVSDEY